MLDLTPDQIADAEACGVSFPTATPAQVQRYAMQKKVFRIGGAAVLATRDGALFETAGTLERLIAEGERIDTIAVGTVLVAPAEGGDRGQRERCEPRREETPEAERGTGAAEVPQQPGA